MKKDTIFLCGFMGSGKSTYGKKLASLLNYSFIDTDEYICEKYQLSITELFKKYGEAEFRNIETTALHEICNSTTNNVVALGGGTPCFNSNLEFIKLNGLLIYIKLTPTQLYNRLENTKQNRPLLARKSKTELLNYITELLNNRTTYYEKAHIVLNGTNLNANQLKNYIDHFKH